MPEPCKGCNKLTDVLYATKETNNRPGGFRCETCYFKFMAAKKKTAAGYRQLKTPTALTVEPIEPEPLF